MKIQRKHRHHRPVLILVLAGLMSCVIFMPGPGGIASAQVATPGWTYTGSLNAIRRGHTATLLPNGKVLVAGGFVDVDLLSDTRTAELYDPATGTWSNTGNLNSGRIWHTATLLANGKVLVAGGADCVKGCGPNTSAELYDPATGTWSKTGDLNASHSGHTATLLQDGKVLIAGGGFPSLTALSVGELYDPGSGTWSNTGSLNTSRSCHTATLLQNDKVLIAGGFSSCSSFHCSTLNTVELYDPASGTWSFTGNLNVARYNHTATLLRDGAVLVAGYFDYETGEIISNSAELYDPVKGIWSKTGNLNEGRGLHTATLLPNGKVLVAAGFGEDSELKSAELYDPATGTWNKTADLNEARDSHSATLLQDGKVLVAAGGADFSGSNSAELYDQGPNPIDEPQFFVRQHYLDFLSREPEQRGLDDWMNFLNSCPAGDLGCLHEHRLTASADFFGSPEFKLKGYFVFRFYRLAFDRLPAYDEIAPDMQCVTGDTPGEVYQKKSDFTNSFVQRPEFVNSFGALSNANYVAALLNNYQLTSITTPDPGNPDGANKVTLSQFELVSRLDATTLTRAQVLRAIADSDEVLAAEINRAFVAMQYYGYLRRTPEPKGYNDWLNYLNAHPTDFREMVRGFMDSIEYRMRFGRP